MNNEKQIIINDLKISKHRDYDEYYLVADGILDGKKCTLFIHKISNPVVDINNIADGSIKFDVLSVHHENLNKTEAFSIIIYE